MEKSLIFVEGKADAAFIRDLLLFLNPKLSVEQIIKNKKCTGYELNNSDTTIKISIGGGYTKIINAKSLFKEHLQASYNILVIIDADSPAKQDGGVLQRLNFLNEVSKNTDIPFKTFLFPNHSDEGDLETLLVGIAKKEHINKSLNCYKNYASCLERFAPKEHCKELMSDKNIIYNYFRTYFGMESAKEENRNFIVDYWDFDCKLLEPLLDFLKNNIIKNKPL